METTLKLLYAEDNPQDADLTRSHFARVAPNLHLEIAESGSHCIERLAAESFDLLLLDNHLPDMDGLDVLEQIRAIGLRLPVVIITGAGDDETVARALRAGASDYISKTGNYLTGLPDILRRLVEQHRSQHQFLDDRSQRQRRILHVEPNPMDVDLTVSHFSSAAPHLQLHTVSNCHDALNLLATGYEFDLVLTDLRVPGMNALDFLHEAKHRGVELPFIVITGRGDEATAVAILRLGAYDYLVKRENYLTQLPHAIDHALQRFQLDQQTRHLHAELASLNASLEEKVAARTAELQREVDERRRLEIQNREQLEKLVHIEAEGSRLLQIAENSRRALLGVLEDQQRTERALRGSERHLRNVLDTLPAMIAVLSPDGMLLDANRLPVEMFGLPFEETIGRPFAELPPWTSSPVQQAELKAAMQRAAAGETVHYYVELPLPSGQVVVIATWIVPLKDEVGNVTQLIASGIDITDRKQAEDALREAKRKLDATINNLSGFVYRYANRPDWPIEYISDGVFDLFGYLAEDFTSGKRAAVSVVVPADRDRTWREVQAAIEARRPYMLEYRIHTATGEEKWALERGTAVFDGDTVVALEGFITDITDRKHAESSLIESQQRLALATDSAHIGIWDWDVVANKLVWDANMYELYGIRPQDFGGAYEAWEAGVHPEDRDRAAAETIAALGGSRDYHTEFRVVWPNGELRHLEAHGVVQRAANGTALRMLGTNWDITERKQSEEALRISHQTLRAGITSTPLSIVMFDRDMRYLAASRRWVEDYGRGHTDLIGRLHYEILPDIPERWKQAHRRGLAGETITNDEDRWGQADGTQLWMRWAIVPWHDERGNVGGIILSVEDITARKRAEEALRAQHAELENLYATTPAGLALVDRNLRFLRINERLAAINGRPAAAHIGRTLEEVLPELAPVLMPIYRRVLDGGEPVLDVEIEGETPAEPGVRREWLASYHPLRAADGSVGGVSIAVVDITDRKRAEAALREKEHLLSESQRIAKIGSWKVDLNGIHVWSAETYRIFEIAPESITLTTEVFLEGLHPDDRKPMLDWIAQCSAGEKPGALEFRIFRRDGTIRFLHGEGELICDRDGHPAYLTGTVQDITERKQAEEALLESEERLRQLAETIDDVFWSTSPDSQTLLYVSPAYEKVWGRSLDSLKANPTHWIADIEHEDRASVVTALKRLRQGEPYSLEYRIRRPDGTQRWVLDRGFPLLDETGKVYRAVGVVNDNTVRKQSEEALRWERDRFDMIVESMPGGIVALQMSPEGKAWYPFASDRFVEIAGVSREILARDAAPFLRMIHSDDYEPAMKAVAESARTLTPFEHEFRFRHPVNGEIWLEVRSMPSRQPDASVLWYGITLDITDRKRAEGALRASEEKLKLAMRAAKLGTWLFNFQTGQFEPDAAGKVLHGFEADEAIVALDQGSRHIHPDDIPQIQQRFEQALRTKGTYENEYRVVLPNGQTRWIYSLGRASAEAPYLIGTVQDVTERKQAEEALRESEHRLRQLFDSSPDALFIIDSAGHFLDANQTAVARYGYSREELLQLSPGDLATSELKEQVPSRVRDSIERGTRFEWRHRRKDGIEFPVEIAAQPLSLNGQRAILSCARDISVRKQAEQAARDSQAMLQLIHDSIPQGVFWKDRNSVYRGANRVCWRAMGFASAQQVVGLSDFDVPSFAREQAEFFIRKDREVMESDQPEFGIVEPMTLPNGETIWLETDKIPMHDADGHVTGILGTWQDITERRQATEELRVSRERLEVLSRQLIATQESERRHLSRELHDEIGQALTSIKLNLKSLEPSSVADADSVQETLSIAEQALQQIRSLALDLRPSMLDDIGLAPALRWCLDRQAHRSGFAPHFLAEPPEITASPEVAITCFRVAQESLTNIARHAQAHNVRVEVRQYESAIDLQVHDDGIGFDVTSATDRATSGESLGLLGMRERTELVGGAIDVESSAATGTTIHARFPLKQTSGSNQ